MCRMHGTHEVEAKYSYIDNSTNIQIRSSISSSVRLDPISEKQYDKSWIPWKDHTILSTLKRQGSLYDYSIKSTKIYLKANFPLGAGEFLLHKSFSRSIETFCNISRWRVITIKMRLSQCRKHIELNLTERKKINYFKAYGKLLEKYLEDNSN